MEFYLEDEFNMDFEKENDSYDLMQAGKYCDGPYCQNCAFNDTCKNKPEGWWE